MARIERKVDFDPVNCALGRPPIGPLAPYQGTRCINTQKHMKSQILAVASQHLSHCERLKHANQTAALLHAVSLSGVIYRKLLSNLLKVYPMKGRLISGLSSTTPTALAAWTCCALSRVALSV